ncbi:UNVERIFIED_CONTAM: site-specific integrase [Bacteroidetes bacterium 56_B9]
MTASLRVKNDKYYVVLTHTTDGKNNQTWVSTGLSVTGNEGKARQLMLDMLGEKPEQAAPHDILFSDTVRRWLENVRHRVDEVTYQSYEVQARAHILPYFDDLQIRLCDVDGETLQTYINVKAKFGRSDGHGGLSAVSLRQHKNVLNQTLKLAQRDGLIQTNPADLVVMPHAAQFTGTFYTESQMRDLLTAVKNERLYPIIYVTALYGLRRSEVLGLKWDSMEVFFVVPGKFRCLGFKQNVAAAPAVSRKLDAKGDHHFANTVVFPLGSQCRVAGGRTFQIQDIHIRFAPHYPIRAECNQVSFFRFQRILFNFFHQQDIPKSNPSAISGLWR